MIHPFKLQKAQFFVKNKKVNENCIKHISNNITENETKHLNYQE